MFDLWTSALYSLIAVVLGLYYHLTKNFTFFQEKGVPFKKPALFFGNIKDRFLLTKSFHELHKEFYFHFKGSPYYGVFEGSTPVLQIADPNLIRNVLVKDFDHFMDRPTIRFKQISPYVEKIMLTLEGKEWKQVRSAVTPAFSSGRLKAMTDIENKCGLQFIKYIQKRIEENGGSGVTLDMKETLGKFTLDTIASTAFGVELDTHSDPNSEMAKKIAKFNDFSRVTRFFLLGAIFLQLPRVITSRIPVSFFNMETIMYLADVVKEVTQKRKESNIRRNDFLQLLIDAQTSSLQESPTSEKDIILTEEVAIAQAILFFIAGYETSATTLTMLCYELAKNHSIQDKVRQEIVDKLKNSNGEVTYEMLNELPYLDMTIAETLRMYPPVSRLDRVCVKTYSLDGMLIQPGDKIGIPVYGLHTDPDYYPEPEQFRPERFSQEEKERRHPLAYLPFGAGPRNCIGLRAAQMSMKICVIHLLKDFKLDKCSRTKIPFEFHKASMLLKAKDGVILEISKI